MNKVIEVRALDNYFIHVKFSDGLEVEIDIQPFIRGGISDALKDKDFFKSVHLDEFSGITWNNGFDFCPNYLREIAESAIGIAA